MSAALLFDAEFPYAQVIRVELPSAEIASIIHDTLAVDKELKPDRSMRNLRIEQGNVLVAEFKAKEARFLRSTVNSFLEHSALSARAIHELGDM